MKFTERYTQQRDKLLAHLGEGAVLLEEHGQSIKSWQEKGWQFRATQHKLRTEQFTIALLAEMQSGKSTLFNSVACGGRELSPVGSKIRTSGCPLSASDLGDAGAEEYALIEWRSDAELIAGFDDLLRGHLQVPQPDRFQPPAKDAEDGADGGSALNLDLKNPADRSLLRAAAERELDLWRKDPANYDPGDTGAMDVVRFALLVAEFYGHPELQAQKQRSRLKVEEISKLVRYPIDWKPRWDAGQANRFQWQEVAFVFIRWGHFFLQAPRLKDIGCTLVDCPGLFASRYDQQITYGTIKAADAILYICPGDKGVSESELKVLRKIRSGSKADNLPKMEHKLFFAWNMKGDRMSAEKFLLPDLKAELRGAGFDRKDEHFCLIHPALALAADQAHRLLAGRMDRHTLEALAERHTTSVDQVPDKFWEKLTEWRRNVTGNQRLAITEDAAAADDAERLGQVDAFVAKAKDFVVRTGPEAILVRNGSEVVADALREVEEELKQREHRAQIKVEEHQAEVAKAETALQSFEREAVEVLDRLDEPGPDREFAEDFMRHLDPGFRTQLAEEIAGGLEPHIGGWSSLKHFWERAWSRFGNALESGNLGGFWREPAASSMERTVRQVCTDIIQNRLSQKWSTWTAEIESGNNGIYNREIGPRIERINRDIKQRWQAQLPAGGPLLRGVKPPEPSSRLAEAVEQVRVNALTDAVIAGQLKKIGTGAALVKAGQLGVVLALAFGKTTTTFLGITLFTTTQPWLWPVVAAAVLAALFGIHKMFSKEKLTPKVADELGKQWETLCDGLRGHASAVGKGIRKFYHHEFTNTVIPHPRKHFLERKAEADRDFAQSQAHREAVAVEARRLREHQIEPLRQRLERFSVECREVFASANGSTQAAS